MKNKAKRCSIASFYLMLRCSLLVQWMGAVAQANISVVIVTIFIYFFSSSFFSSSSVFSVNSASWVFSASPPSALPSSPLLAYMAWPIFIDA